MALVYHTQVVINFGAGDLILALFGYFDGLLETDESAFMSNSIFSYLFPTFVGDFLFEGS